MKDNRTQELTATAETASAEIENGAAAELGKFKDVKALLDAYTALEAEFTRRSQRLKELEANKEANGTATAAITETPSQKAAGAEGEQSAFFPLPDEVKNAVIEEYLNGVCRNRSVPFVTGGGAVPAKRSTPTTLRQAGMLAKDFFDIKEDN